MSVKPDERQLTYTYPGVERIQELFDRALSRDVSPMQACLAIASALIKTQPDIDRDEYHYVLTKERFSWAVALLNMVPIADAHPEWTINQIFDEFIRSTELVNMTKALNVAINRKRHPSWYQDDDQEIRSQKSG